MTRSKQSRPRPLSSYPEAMTPGEVAEFFRVHVEHVYRLIRRGDLPSVRVGHSLRVPRERLAAQLAGEGSG